MFGNMNPNVMMQRKTLPMCTAFSLGVIFARLTLPKAASGRGLRADLSSQPHDW
jgi:hypothetical protein